MADKAAFTAWLGVVVDPGTGVKYQLGGTLKTLLIALYDAGSIDVDDKKQRKKERLLAKVAQSALSSNAAPPQPQSYSSGK